VKWLGSIGIVAGAVAWHLAALRLGPLLLPTPVDVARAIVEERNRLGEALFHTATAAMGGLLLATSLAMLAAILSWASAAVRVALVPYTVLVQVIPIVAIAPLLVVWLGYGKGVAASTAAIASFYPVFSAASTGIRAPGQDLVDLFRLYGASRLQELWRLRLPASLPATFSGLRSAGGLSVIGAIVGEFVGSNGFPPTLGQLVVYTARSAELDLCFGAIAAAAALALVVNATLARIERRVIGGWYGR
jgi:NitT/TauT family transport system permease protein